MFLVWHVNFIFYFYFTAVYQGMKLFHLYLSIYLYLHLSVYLSIYLSAWTAAEILMKVQTEYSWISIQLLPTISI